MQQDTKPLTGSILHSDTCPICHRLWLGMTNDLERLAHLVVCALQVRF